MASLNDFIQGLLRGASTAQLEQQIRRVDGPVIESLGRQSRGGGDREQAYRDLVNMLMANQGMPQAYGEPQQIDPSMEYMGGEEEMMPQQKGKKPALMWQRFSEGRKMMDLMDEER